MLDLDYVLSIKSTSTDGDDVLTDYLVRLAAVVRVIVVDGSPAAVFQIRAERWAGLVAHRAPDLELAYRNGKVNAVLTGLRAATAEKVVLADDDVRYDAGALAQMNALLDRFDLVRPQNYFAPAPWHARWDTARSLLNRLAPGGDYPGTLGVRRLSWLVTDGYDGDVLFENLELIRTVAVRGGSACSARDLYVQRLPCSKWHFLGQRIRQAYDSQAQPTRLVAELSVLPLFFTLRVRRRRAGLAAVIAGSIALAELGRRRDGGSAVFPGSASAWTPVWLLERGICSWLAVGTRVLLGGVRYSGIRIRVAAHSSRQLRVAAATDSAVGASASAPMAARDVPAFASRAD